MRLNWLMILQKREVFRRCFQGFSPEKVAALTGKDVERILKTTGMMLYEKSPRRHPKR